MDSLESLDFSSFIIFSDDPWSLLVSFRQLFKLQLVVQCCDVICDDPYMPLLTQSIIHSIHPSIVNSAAYTAITNQCMGTGMLTNEKALIYLYCTTALRQPTTMLLIIHLMCIFFLEINMMSSIWVHESMNINHNYPTRLCTVQVHMINMTCMYLVTGIWI